MYKLMVIILLTLSFSVLLWSTEPTCPIHKVVCHDTGMIFPGSGARLYHCGCGDEFWVAANAIANPQGSVAPIQPDQPPSRQLHPNMAAIGEQSTASCHAQGWIIYKGTCMSPQQKNIEVAKDLVKDQCHKKGGRFKEIKKANVWLCLDKAGTPIPIK
jgi:hypothetical protein